MASRSLTKRQLSRSKLELFLECPRCFHEDIAGSNPRPGGPPLTLNNAVDELFKREFDACRARQEPHPLFATVGLDAIPLQDARFMGWRDTFAGMRWQDPTSGWTLCGLIDDLWRGADGRVIVADYKATAKREQPTTETLHPAYRRQVEIYQFLVEQQGLPVDDRAWFVYANGLKDADSFSDTLRFRTTLVPCDGNRSWVLDAFRRAVAAATAAEAPAPFTDCKFCKFALAYASA